MDKQQFMTYHIDALIAYAMGKSKQAPEHTLECSIWTTGLCDCGAKTEEDTQDDTTTK